MNIYRKALIESAAVVIIQILLYSLMLIPAFHQDMQHRMLTLLFALSPLYAFRDFAMQERPSWLESLFASLGILGFGALLLEMPIFMHLSVWCYFAGALFFGIFFIVLEAKRLTEEEKGAFRRVTLTLGAPQLIFVLLFLSAAR